MPNGIPLFRDDERAIVGFRFVEKGDIGELDSVKSCVGSQSFEEELKVGNGTGLEDIQDDGVDVRRDHLHHLQPDDRGTDDAGDLGDGLTLLVDKLERSELLSDATDGLAIDIGHLLDQFVVVERTEAFSVWVLQHLCV